MVILKDSEKYTVLKITNKKKIIILKISNRKQEKIYNEINHIKKLKRTSKFFDKRIPKIISYGKFKTGVNKNKAYYKMDFVDGPTLSEILQKNILNKRLNNKLFQKLTISLIDELRRAKLIKKNNSFKYFNQLLKDEYNKIVKKKLFKHLLNKNNIQINNYNLNNISSCLDKIFKSKKIIKFIKNYNFISDFNHWNFHGGNLIFPNNEYKNFKIIDPDSSWKFNDPFFSLARLIYTFPHDTMEYNKYFIQSSNFFKKNSNKKISFTVNYSWNTQILKNYKELFQDYFTKFNKKNFLKKKLNQTEFLRFNLSLILCFLRGINANHERNIYFLNDKSKHFQNKGLYLYLFFLIYLNKFVNELYQ